MVFQLGTLGDASSIFKSHNTFPRSTVFIADGPRSRCAGRLIAQDPDRTLHLLATRVGVALQHPQGCPATDLLDHPKGNPGCHHRRGTRVSQHMMGHAGKPDFPQEPPKGHRHGCLGRGLAVIPVPGQTQTHLNERGSVVQIEAPK